MPHFYVRLLLLLLLVLTGCKTPLEKIDQFVAEEDFEGALAYLVEKGVASTVSDELDRSDEEVQKLLVARDLYRRKIEERFGKEAASVLESGKSRAARRMADAALLRCVWSDELRRLATRATKAVARLDEGLAAYARLDKADFAAHWAFVEGFKPDVKIAADDAAFIEALESVSRKLAATEAAGLRDDLERGDAEAVNSRIEKVRLLYVDESQLSRMSALAREILASHVVPRLLEGEEIHGFIAKRAKWSGITQPQLRDVLGVLLESADGWMTKSLRMAVERKHDAKGVVDAVEELYVSRGRRNQSDFCLADLHVIRGTRLAKEGANASAALFHFERARELNPSADVLDLIELAKSTRGKLKPMTVSLTLSSGAEAAPDTIGPVYYISALNLIEKTREGVRWALSEPETPGADVTLFIEKAERFVPKVADLSVVQSRYFAHMQSVPNPQKGYLKGQLNAAEMSYQFALSSYNSAVSSFNIYPSQYSLNAVNYAENNLESARTRYNSLVSLYNATPTTVEEPVYMPYSFFEGNMRCGYVAAGKVLVQGTEAQFASHRVDSHYVRLNTKFTDISATNRRDVHYPVENVSEQLFANIVAVAADVTEKVASVRILPADEFIGNISEGEKACVAYAMHPLKQPDAAGLGLPAWARKFAETCRFVGVKVLPPERYLERCVRDYPAAFDDPLSIELMRGMVCRIDCQSPFGDSRGSGSVISADGLILTAAHVIRGSANKVVFNYGPNKGEFETEIVFVDDRSDVAVLRAKSLRSERWFNVRFGEFPSPGDPVMAIGYPGRPSEGDATQDFVTRGIISASNSSKGWLVADLTVASGNSGGPIISAKTGEILGVVSQVISASIKKNYAASGFWCKAFPAARLTEALGLKDHP